MFALKASRNGRISTWAARPRGDGQVRSAHAAAMRTFRSTWSADRRALRSAHARDRRMDARSIPRPSSAPGPSCSSSTSCSSSGERARRRTWRDDGAGRLRGAPGRARVQRRDLLVSTTSRETRPDGTRPSASTAIAASPGAWAAESRRLVLRGKDTGDVERESDTVLVLAQEPWKSKRPSASGRGLVRGGQEPRGRPAWCALRFDGTSSTSTATSPAPSRELLAPEDEGAPSAKRSRRQDLNFLGHGRGPILGNEFQTRCWPAGSSGRSRPRSPSPALPRAPSLHDLDEGLDAQIESSCRDERADPRPLSGEAGDVRDAVGRSCARWLRRRRPHASPGGRLRGLDRWPIPFPLIPWRSRGTRRGPWFRADLDGHSSPTCAGWATSTASWCPPARARGGGGRLLHGGPGAGAPARRPARAGEFAHDCAAAACARGSSTARPRGRSAVPLRL